VKKYIDFAAANGFDGVLVVGMKVGKTGLVMPRLCFDFAILILMLKEFTLTQKQKG
jgi:coenzyme F420-reducing hydrogenase delta subunit